MPTVEWIRVTTAAELSGALAKKVPAIELYDGSLRQARFDSVTSTGGIGTSLVRGVRTQLSATALSVKEGGHVGTAEIGGRIASRGDGVTTVEIDGGLDTLTVTGGIHADGPDADAVHLTTDHGSDLGGIAVTAAHGRPLVRNSP
ncbi:hypothetical protein [Streptomyces clavuligerus]|uniref:Uncharacterized protein n=1 Tax=Streptomyces clavuligerus TaxID=1901 RepID=B5GLZ6_STRCL|nr:hypothetical protein [Streptomyces clavuligerus]EDY47342.1 hypothetical protein SSCG_00370 [Streptomyces clavuligerus]EFG05000.1 Hypothetical protein SCLAV_p1519 [Streptomyces clavuligerus]MBY6306579.1 hypothetical protein [Streptomyces clavuligerus]QCS10814.1 hypothetical protein CRV15_35480 [Streptomyces clavuligerus]QPJ97149.1 hypothetical protein GE265_28995 [Streptomyces clavuligerus]